MNIFSHVLLVVAVAAVSAEPPRFRSGRYRSQRQELAPAEPEPEKHSKGEEPYPSSGFRPPKEFKLPARQEIAPTTSYVTPADSYGAPLNTFTASHTEYGVPLEREAREKSEEPEEKSDVESVKVEELGEKQGRLREADEDTERADEIVSAQGAYYVLLPNAQVQRVQFQTENDLRNMAYTAKLQYRSEDRAPVYLYAASAPATPGVVQRAAYVQLV